MALAKVLEVVNVGLCGAGLYMANAAKVAAVRSGDPSSIAQADMAVDLGKQKLENALRRLGG